MKTTVLLANLVVRTWAVREASYIPTEWVLDEAGTRIPNGGDYYETDIDDAYESAAEELTVGDAEREDLRKPVTLMLYWSNDALTWARGIIERDTPNETAQAVQAEASATA